MRVCDFPKMQVQLSNHSSNENVPKSKSVEFSKIYNFALRSSFKRVKDLNLI
jgi:hypothetical protein